jgi:hypothetical protein
VLFLPIWLLTNICTYFPSLPFVLHALCISMRHESTHNASLFLRPVLWHPPSMFCPYSGINSSIK